MDVSLFDYELPPEAIAQRPAPERDGSRLLVLERGGLDPGDRAFRDLPALLAPGDLLVVNETQVLPARLHGRKSSGGRVEALLIERVQILAEREDWTALLRFRGSLRPGDVLTFEERLAARVLGRREEIWTLAFETPGAPPGEWLERVGQLPLPPYIRREQSGPDSDDARRYQTVFARIPGSVAAPTAGLHFSWDLLARLERRGVTLAGLTLHVGPGTFQPVRVERVEDHRMHEERFLLQEDLVAAVERTRRGGGRVIAVGTTVVRALEHQAKPDGTVAAGSGRSSLFIYPGYRFRVVDALITNFHLPRSTLLMLVCAFGGTAPVLAAYRRALELGYRFYSYGDAMFVR